MSSSELSSDDAVTQANTKLAELAPSTDHADKYILAKSLENRDEHIEMDWPFQVNCRKISMTAARRSLPWST